MMITNLTSDEPIFVSYEVRVNGQEYSALVREVDGSAKSKGFLEQENKALTFLIDVDGGLDAIETLDFTLLVLNTDGEELYRTPVQITK